MAMSVLASLVAGLTLAAVLGLWAMLRKFVREQRAANRRNAEFQRSQQRAEIIRAFQRHVEDRRPASIEEMDHLDKSYEAYHANGGNGTGTAMYERVKEHARIVTKFD